MPTQSRYEETTAIRPEETSAPGERLDAALAADQAERERLRRIWERRRQRWITAASTGERARKLLFFPGAIAFFVGAGLLICLEASELSSVVPVFAARCVGWTLVIGLIAVGLALLIEPVVGVFHGIAAALSQAAARDGVEISPGSREARAEVDTAED